MRDFNLTPKELDGVFSKARIEGGGLDLHKLVEKLKEIKGRRPLKNKTVVDQNIVSADFGQNGNDRYEYT